jgi:nitrogen regulatory protein P-II 1
MKEIKAVIQPHRLSRLRHAFRRMKGFPGMTVVHAQGCSAEDDADTDTSLMCELTEFSNKVRIEIIATEEQLEEIVKIIYESGHSGQKGDGIVWVTDVGAFRRLRHSYD